MGFERIGCFAGDSASCQLVLAGLQQQYKLEDADRNQDIDIILVVGGDGVMLRALHRFSHLKVPFYGINAGTIGFMMNKLGAISLPIALNKARRIKLKPLLLQATDRCQQIHKAFAINEVSVFRASPQAAKLRITTDQGEYIEEMIADGALVATPAGSRAYNLAAGGQVMPLQSNMLCLTPICPFRPQYLRSILINNSHTIDFEILEHSKRPVHAAADFLQVDNVVSINISLARDKTITLLLDQEHDFILSCPDI